MDKASTNDNITSDKDIIDNILSKIKVDQKSQDDIAMKTQEQSGSTFWYEQRRVRITGSNFGKVCKRQSNFEKLAQDISSSKSVTAPALDYGHHFEPKARQAYEDRTKNQVGETGLVVDIENPWMGTSPDGVLKDGKGIIEIKCPYKARDCKDIEEAVKTDCISYLKKQDKEINGSQYYLDKKHDYHYQIQGILHVLKREYCDFVVYSKQFLEIVRVEKDEKFIQDMISTLKKFYYEHYIFQLASIEKAKLRGDTDSNNDNSIDQSLKASLKIEYLGDIIKKEEELKAKFQLGKKYYYSVKERVLGVFNFENHPEIEFIYTESQIIQVKKPSNTSLQYQTDYIIQQLEGPIDIKTEQIQKLIYKKVIPIKGEENQKIAAILAQNSSSNIFILDITQGKLIKTIPFPTISQIVDIAPFEIQNHLAIISTSQIVKANILGDSTTLIEKEKSYKVSNAGPVFNCVTTATSNCHLVTGGKNSEIKFFSEVGSNATNKVEITSPQTEILSIDISPDQRFALLTTVNELILLPIGNGTNRSGFTHRLTPEQKSQMIRFGQVLLEKGQCYRGAYFDRSNSSSFIIAGVGSFVFIFSIGEVLEGNGEAKVNCVKSDDENIGFVNFVRGSKNDIFVVSEKI